MIKIILKSIVLNNNEEEMKLSYVLTVGRSIQLLWKKIIRLFVNKLGKLKLHNKKWTKKNNKLKYKPKKKNRKELRYNKPNYKHKKMNKKELQDKKLLNKPDWQKLRKIKRLRNKG